MTRKILPLLTLGILLSGLASPPRSQAADRRVTDDEIQAALKRAVANLRQKVSTLDGGEGALVTMALLKSGLPPDTPEVKAGIDKILQRISGTEYKAGSHHVYEAGVSLMALANANPETYKPQIEAIARYLMDKQRPDGEWDYPSPGNGDTSITQYAILGLWEAARSGVSVPKRVWDKAAGWHVSRQLKDGSFTYHPPPPSADGFTLGMPGTHSMTAAGTASLLVCRLHLYPGASDPDEVRKSGNRSRGKKWGILIPAVVDEDDAPDVVENTRADDANYRTTTRLSAVDKAVRRGQEWLADHFTVAPSGNYELYYLYGLERLAALAGVKEIGGHDWYAEGAAHLVATQGRGSGQFAAAQQADMWNDTCGPTPATAFGILFLGKATEKMLGRKAVRRNPKFGGGLLIGGRGLPENLESLTLDQGGVKVRKLKGPVDELLAELENAQSRQVESAQATLVETVATDDPEALIGQSARLLKLARDSRVEVRRTVFWALGRTNELRVVPTLIAGLDDPDPACRIEARNALRFISKRIDVRESPDEASPQQRAAAVAYWKKWYLTVRPYDERDDLGEAPAKAAGGGG
ncbi:MAG: HEAT repeat domain-containing protein [Deltaproteobacteria bacterium]